MDFYFRHATKKITRFFFFFFLILHEHYKKEPYVAVENSYGCVGPHCVGRLGCVGGGHAPVLERGMLQSSLHLNPRIQMLRIFAPNFGRFSDFVIIICNIFSIGIVFSNVTKKNQDQINKYIFQ